jgi:hypothetical protein
LDLVSSVRVVARQRVASLRLAVPPWDKLTRVFLRFADLVRSLSSVDTGSPVGLENADRVVV